MTRDEAGKIISVLFATYPSATLTVKNVEAYASAILDLDAKVAGEAVNRLRLTKTFLPSISEIRACAADIVLGPMRSGEEAYGVLMTAVRACGWPAPPRFRDANITRAIGVWGSWADLCRSPADDPGGRARFIELYEQGATRERADAIAGKALPGPRASRQEFAPLARPVPNPQAQPMMIVAVHGPSIPSVSRPVSPIAGKRMSADEIEEALRSSK